MDTKANSQETKPAVEPKYRYLDSFEEWRDHANQWDVSELLHAHPVQPQPQEKKVNVYPSYIV